MCEELAIAQFADRTGLCSLPICVFGLIWVDSPFLDTLGVVRETAEGAHDHFRAVLECVVTRWTLLDGLSLRDGPLPKEDSLLVIVFESHPSNLKLLALLVEDLDEIGFD